MEGLRGVRAIKRKSTFFEELISKPGWLLYDIDSPFKGTAANSEFIRDFIERYDKVHLTESENFYTLHVPTNVFFQLPKKDALKVPNDELLKFTKARLNGITIPPALNSREIITRFGTYEDTVRVVMKAIRTRYVHLIPYAKTLKRDTVEATCKAIYRDVKVKIPYARDRKGIEEVKDPLRTISDGEKGIGSDCEDMTILIGCYLYALQIPFIIRLIGIENYEEPDHIYPVATDNENRDTYAIDCIPEVPAFDFEFNYLIKFKKDYPMEIHYLNGVGAGDEKTSLLSLMRNNYLNQATLLSYGYDNSAQAEPEVKQAARAALQRLLARFEQRGGDKLQLIRAIDEGRKTAFDAGALQGATGIVHLMEVGDTAELSGIKDFLRGDKRIKAGLHKVNRVAFAVFRTPLLQLLKLNFRGFARRWSKAGGDLARRLKNLWYNIGGDEGKLSQAINEGRSKKPIFGENKKKKTVQGGEDLGAVALASVIAAAGTILTVIAPLLKQVHAPEPEAAMEEPAGESAAEATSAPQETVKQTGATARTGTSTSPDTGEESTNNYSNARATNETAKDMSQETTTTENTSTTTEEKGFKAWYTKNKKWFLPTVIIVVVLIVMFIGYRMYKKKKTMGGVRRRRSPRSMAGVSVAGASRPRARTRALPMRQYYALPAAPKPRKRRKRAA